MKEKGKSAETYQQLGKALVKAKYLEEALIAFKKSLELNEQDPWSHLYIGNIYYRKKQYEEAVMWFEKSTNLLKDSATPLWCLAEAFEKLDKMKLADFYFRKATEVDTENEEALKRLQSWNRRYVK